MQELELGLFCLSSLITLTDCSSLFIKLSDFVMFGLALMLDVMLVGCQTEVRCTVSYTVLPLDVSGMQYFVVR